MNDINQGAFEMNAANVIAHKFYGLLELDTNDTVLYSRAEGDDGVERPPDDLVGRNFYASVTQFRNVEDFRELLARFVRSRDRAGGFSFVCEYADGDVPVKVLLANIRELTDNRHTSAILLHIRKAI